MTELDVKLVKVDNWGIFFLQRLKHFFNRTDYCDLTLQFQDNAQLKVHRLVLSACTEYFELLERTCEMYEDCLVMPDDLQADVVVPIVNFMYTGQLEFRQDLLERLYQTSQIMNMPVLTKLLDAHRNQSGLSPVKPSLTYSGTKRSYSKPRELLSKPKQIPAVASSSQSSQKRSHIKAFGNIVAIHKESKKSAVSYKSDAGTNNGVVAAPYGSPDPIKTNPSVSKKILLGEPRPTRYELPEELDSENLFDNSFSNISYTSQPLMVHPDTTKQYQPKKSTTFDKGSKKLGGGTSTLDIVECKRIPKRENIFDEDPLSTLEDSDMFQEKEPNVSNQLFDQIIDQPEGPKVTIETKDNKQASNIDHAKIISEVLKKYPHLVKSNKNIKLKILNTPTKPVNKAKKKQQNSPKPFQEEQEVKFKTEAPDFTYETDVLDSKEAARLIALGAENIKGPWICLICGTPGRALHFASYYKFRRHLVEVHNEKPVVNMCEYCGLKSLKRNYLLHHLLTKHGINPPPTYNFPKCNLCNYVALSEGLLLRHKLSHGTELRNFRCNVCTASYGSSNELLSHIHSTGHKYCDRKSNFQCVYCMKVFLREGNLYAHLKTYHKPAAKLDGIIDDSEDEQREEAVTPLSKSVIKYEPQNIETEYDEDVEAQYQIRPDGDIELITSKKQRSVLSTPAKQKILNSGLGITEERPVRKMKSPTKNVPHVQTDSFHEEIVVIGNNEYIVRDNQLIHKKRTENEFILPEISNDGPSLTTSVSSPEYSNNQNTVEEEQKMIIKKTANINQPIQIVVSNEEEYKALMNSNHSIIFDDGNTNKTLTVLSAPHSTTINPATLDLDNAQSNDMMIIQENYPMTVSEAIPTDNSNIVVVYSHPVDDQNKQYQIITSQNIGSQFVQSSAVITQNFETVTTSTPVMTAEVINTQVAESWQNNLQENQGAQLHEMTIVENPEMTTVSTVAGLNTIDDLPEVTLTSIAPQNSSEATLEQNEENLNQPAVNTINGVDNVEAIIESENAQLTHMDVDMPTETIIEDTSASEMVSIDPLPQDSVITETEDMEETIQPQELEQLNQNIKEKVQTAENLEQVSENIVAHVAENVEEQMSENIEEQMSENIEEQMPEDIIISETNDTSAVTENIETEAATAEEVVINEETSIAQAVPVINENVIVTKEKIQSLTSEWSEDEYDTEEQEQLEENTDKDRQDNEAAEPQEIEESIENIQQEMDKHVSEVSESGVNMEDNDSNLQEQLAPVVAPQEKISSLLNDWDENDSQEGNESTNGTEENVQTEATENVSQLSEAELTIMDKVEPKKDDKIRSLVSDWDDDEEDGKNN